MLFGVCVLCRILLLRVTIFNVSFSGLIASVGDERADFAAIWMAFLSLL